MIEKLKTMAVKPPGIRASCILTEKPSQGRLFLNDVIKCVSGYGRIIEYRAFNSSFQPDACRIERVKEGRFSRGKMDGYGRKFTGLNGGNCLVGFFEKGKPKGKL